MILESEGQSVAVLLVPGAGSKAQIAPTPVSGVGSQAVQAALDVGHLLQHLLHAGLIQLQTNELRVLQGKEKVTFGPGPTLTRFETTILISR